MLFNRDNYILVVFDDIGYVWIYVLYNIVGVEDENGFSDVD